MSKMPKKNLRTPKRVDPPNVEVMPPSRIPKTNDPVVKSVTHTQTWSGPFLPPNVMKEYDNVVQDGAARLFNIFEDETKHRREMEAATLKYQGRDLLVGKFLALAFTFAVLGVVMFAIQKNAPWVAAILGAGMLGTIVFGFLRIFGDGPTRSPDSKANDSKKNS